MIYTLVIWSFSTLFHTTDGLQLGFVGRENENSKGSQMPGENLTRIEASERAALIEVDSYQVEIDLTQGAELFGSTTRVRFSAKPGSASFIDAITAAVHSVVLNGEVLDPATVSDGIRIQLPNLAEKNELVVVAQGKYTNTGEGLHRFVDPVDNEVYLYTQFEVPDSRRMFAVFEQPDLKATFQFNITAPSYWKVISNSPTPEQNDLREGISVWNFEPTPRISSYITALIAGPYVEVNDQLTSSSGKIIPLGVFCRKSLFEFLDAEYIFEKTKQGFEFFETQFGVAYPFEKYDQLFVPEFNAGAMENAGAVTFTETYVFRSKVTDATKERRVVTILHELAHMWFGDLVTMKWWNDLWLNESFAEYASTLATQEATEWHGAWATFASLEKSWAYRQDQLPSTHPIVATINDLEDVQVNFDGITYAKGASVLKQLVAWVGQEPFMKGVSSYFKKHAYKNTELKDLLTELEAQSGRDLSEWSKLWLETAGVNTLRPEITEKDGVIESFSILQSAIDDYPYLRPHRLAVGCYEEVAGKLVRTERIELDVQGAKTLVPELAGKKRPALILLNDDDLTYAKIRLDEQSWNVALEKLALVEDPLARALIWGAAWDATRDGESSARDFIKLALSHISLETESTTMMTILRQLLTVANLYVSPANRLASQLAVAEGLWSLATDAEAGSDAQLQFVKFFAQFARSDKQLSDVDDLLTGKISLSGLAIDADLRWELITALSVGGKITKDLIDSELANDNTANGQKSHAAAIAALPDATSKKEIFSKLVDTDLFSNALTNSASLAFGRVLDTSILEPFVDQYFDKVLPIWEKKSYHMAEYLLVNLYPLALANQAIAKKTKDFLENPEVQSKPALRRIIIENLANVERALKAQSRDLEG
jgi:aminopeptidase N